MEKDVLEKRKESIINFFKNKKSLLIIFTLIVLSIFTFYLRIRNLDVLGGNLADPDAHAFLRYAREIVQNGYLSSQDNMRYYPLGFNPVSEFGFLSYFIAYLYKFISFFNSSITLEQIAIIYPAITTALSVFLFFLMVRKMFDYRIALLSTLFLVVIPPYLFRTMSGVSDKEALAMPLMFLSFYLILSSFQAKKLKNSLILAVFSGIATGLTALSWGGVTYILVVIAGFTIFELFLMKFSKRDFYVYTIWVLITLGMMATLGGGRYSLSILASSFTTAPLIFALFYGLVNFLFFNNNLLGIKTKLEKIKFPVSINLFIITLIFSYLLTSLFFGPTFLFKVFLGNLGEIFDPEQNDRWSLTVAENHQVYVSNWFGDFGPYFVWIFIIGSIILFYDTVKNLEKYKLKLTFAYTIFILGFIFSKYDPGTIFNGESTLSLITLYGSILIFVIYAVYVYIHSFIKDKETFEQISNIDKKYSIIFLWFLIGIVGATFLARLVFSFVPVVVILFGFFIFSLVDFIRKTTKIKTNNLRIVSYIIIGMFVTFLFFTYTNNTLAVSSSIGPIYNYQWQQAEKWVKTNTPENSVFLHWWDYGYLVQTGFDRATVTDGGNVIGPWNFYVGRYILTAPLGDKETTNFMKTHDVSYLLIVSEDIGKYPAYSSIGSDQKYDRYSWIGTYVIDPSQINEKQNVTELFYRGGVAIDEDFVYNGKVFPREQAAIYGFIVPISKENQSKILQPIVLLYYNGGIEQIPLECIYLEDSEIIFKEKGFKGCLRFIPYIAGMPPNQQVNSIGAAIYVSEKVRNTLFTKLYIYGEDTEEFTNVYSDENSGFPLVIYEGRLIGPLKIWKVNYPSTAIKNETYLQRTYLNPEVTYLNN